MQLDYELLNERIKEHKKSQEFLWYGLELLQSKYNFPWYFTYGDLLVYFPDMPPTILRQMAEGEVPDMEEVIQLDMEILDHFVQEILHLIGCGLGVAALEQMAPEEASGGYVKFLHHAQQDKEMIYVIAMFSALSLAMEVPPSFAMLARMAPLNQKDHINEMTGLLVGELHADLITKWIGENHPEVAQPAVVNKFFIPTRPEE